MLRSLRVMWLTWTVPESRRLTARPAGAGADALVVPSGQPLYESLTAQFVVFHRIAKGLSEVGHSGYLRFLGDGVNAIVLLRSGRIVDCVLREGDSIVTDLEALQALERRVDGGEGTLDVVELEPALVDGLHLLATGTDVQPELRSSWVRLEALVEHLEEIGFTGSVTVEAAAGVGAIILDRGRRVAAFRAGSAAREDSWAACQELSRDRQARFRLRGVEGATEPVRSPVAQAVTDALNSDLPQADSADLE